MRFRFLVNPGTSQSHDVHISISQEDTCDGFNDKLKFKTLGSSLLATGMLTCAANHPPTACAELAALPNRAEFVSLPAPCSVSEWRTDGILSVRTQPLALVLYSSYILVTTLLVINLLISRAWNRARTGV